ncbi:Uma2 family endonuclease [Nocardiopsis chromatogenes]|uniref:Uma2 family endonuclease n=1 Tax=Nocardiopsis chromatogenes TaxID=280239 RepID=UPI00034A5AB6|nr:Uma2 family endonuclease [Nocardiopsis chromatogenes]
MTVTTPDGAVDLFKTLDELDVPKGYRAEILREAEITVSPPPIGKHQRNVKDLDRQIVPHLPEGYDTEVHLEIRMHHIVKSTMPDLFVAPEPALDTEDYFVSPDDVILAAEVVSRSNSGNDRVEKLGIYAAAAIPLYLLIDPIRASTTLYFSPEDGHYTENVTAPFGKSVEIPEPFGFELDTSRFRTY